MQHIYFLSTGRCGTTFVSDFINHHYPSTNIIHQSSWSRLLNILGNYALSGLISKNTLLKSYSLLRNRGRSICEVLPQSTTDPLLAIPIMIGLEKCEYLTESNVKIVHLVRDPRDFVSSFMNWKSQSSKRWILHHVIPMWQPSPMFLEDRFSLTERFKMTKFEHFCWIWNYKNNLFRRLSHHPNYLCLRFEDLIANKKKKVWETMFSFFEIDGFSLEDINWSQKKVNKSKKTHFPKWEEWTVEQAKTLDKWCGETMKDYNYGNEDKWRSLTQ